MLSQEKESLVKAFNSPTIESFNKHFNERSPKNLKSSVTVRSEANNLFKKTLNSTKANLYEDIWTKYTLSIALAFEKSCEQAYAYAERSVLLLHMRKFDDSLLDIDRAINIVNSNYLKSKFLCIKAINLDAMNEPYQKILNRAEFYANKIIDDKEKSHILDMIEKIEHDSTVDLNNNNIMTSNEEERAKQSRVVQKAKNYDSAVTLDYNSKYGKHLIASRDIQPGEIVFIEEPYAITLNLNKIHPICSNCFTTCWSSISCDSCVSSVYCSEKCRKDAWTSYHMYECVVLNDCRWSKYYDVFSLSIRLLISSFREAGSIEKLEDLIQSAEKVNAGEPMKHFVRHKKLGSYGFKSIFSLSSDITSTFAMETYPIIALQMLITLARRTTFFGRKFNSRDCYNIIDNDDAMFIGSLILKLIKICHLCKTKMISPSISSLSTCEYVKDVQSHRKICLATIFSLINHSCDPNVMACFNDKNEVVIYALRPIKKDEQIFKSYIHNHYSAEMHNRESFLEDAYNFVCNCDACEGNWPGLPFPARSMKREEYFDEFFESLCETSVEKDVYRKYKSLIMSIIKREDSSVESNEEVVSDISEYIFMVSEELPRHSIVYRFLILVLNFISSQVYGCHMKFPDHSVNVTYPFNIFFLLSK